MSVQSTVLEELIKLSIATNQPINAIKEQYVISLQECLILYPDRPQEWYRSKALILVQHEYKRGDSLG